MLSLPDWAFYTISSAVAAGMVATAMSLGDADQRTPEEVRAEGITFDGDNLATLTVGGGLTVEFLSENNTQYARISAARGPLDGMQSAGAFFTLTAQEIEALQGHRVRLTYVLRSPQDHGADFALLNFFVPGRSQNDWENHPIESSFGAVSIDLSPPHCDWDFAYVGVWPDWRANGNLIDLKRVELTVLEPVTCTD